MKPLFIIFILILTSISLQAEEQWTHFICSGSTKGIAREGDFIWTANYGGVVRFNIHDGTAQKFLKNDGLCENSTQSVIIDKKGRKWFGHYDGLTVVDGDNWSTIAKEDQFSQFSSRAIAARADGAICICTPGGILINEGQNQEWILHKKPDKMVLRSVWDLEIQDEGIYWMAADSGIFRYDGIEWRRYFNESCKELAVDESGNIWAGTTWNLLKYNGAEWKKIDIDLGSTYPAVWGIEVDQENIVWISTLTNGVYAFKDSTWLHFTHDDGLFSNYVNSIFIDHENTKWFGHAGDLTSFDGKSWRIYNGPNEPGFHAASAAGVDLSGNLWIGSAFPGYGIARFDGKTWDNFYGDENNKGYAEITGIAADKTNRIWFAGYNNIFVLDELMPTWYSFKQDMWSTTAFCVAVDQDDSKWFGFSGGVRKYDNQLWYNYTTDDGLISNSVRHIAVDKENNKWFGTNEGLSRFDGKNWTNFTVENGLPDNAINDLDVDRTGNLWVATAGGLCKYNGITWTQYPGNPIIPVTSVWQLAVDSSNVLWSIAKVKDRPTAIVRLEGDKWKAYTAENYVTLPWVNDIAVDHENNKWFIDDYGITRLSETVTAVENRMQNVCSFELAQNFPNPFNASTTINYSILEKNYSPIQIFITNILGQNIKHLFSGNRQPGDYTCTWNGEDDTGKICPSGLYFCVLQTGNQKMTRKMLLLK